MKICVLDIETIPNARAMADARYTHTDEFAPWPLHELAAASILTVERTNWDELGFSLQSYSRGSLSERGIVACVEECVTDADEVTTYNGKAFDLPVLINRAIANVVPVPTLARLHDRGRPGLHVDLHDRFKGTGAGISLSHLCAGLGIPVKQHCGDTVADCAARGDWTAIEHYCESDVIATWLATQMWSSPSDPEFGWDRWARLACWCRETQGANARLRDWPLPPAIK